MSHSQIFSQSNQRFSQICWGIYYSHSNLSIWFLWLISASSYACQWRSAHYWMKTANWKNPKRFLKLQTGNQPTTLLYYQAWAIATGLHWAIPRAFPKPVDWNRIQACTQKSDETVHDCYSWLQIIFKENSDFPSDVDSTQVGFSSMFISGLNWHLSLQVKKARMECKIISTPDLVNLANQRSHTLHDSPIRKTAKIHNLQLQQLKVPK